MFDALSDANALETREALFSLVGQLAESTVANIVDPAYTVVAKFPKRYLR